MRLLFAISATVALVASLVVAAPPPASAGTPEPLGIPLTQPRVSTSQAGHWTDGRPVVYMTGGSPGEDVQFVVMDVATGQQIASHSIPAMNDSLSMTVAPDGRVYIPAWGPQALLYRYSPSTDTMTDLGVVVPGETHITRLDIAADGRLFGGTFPNAHVFELDPITDSIIDHGSIDPNQTYARSIAYDEAGAVYIGTEGTAHIFRMDLATDAVTELSLPPDMDPGDYRISLLAWRDGLLFAYFTASQNWHIYDPATSTWIDSMLGAHAPSMPTEVDANGRVYLANADTARLMYYDLDDNTQGATQWNQDFDYALGGGGMTLIDLDPSTACQFGPGTIVGMGRDGRLWYWSPATNAGLVRTGVEPPVANITIRAIGLGPDDDIYVGMSFSNGALYRWDPDTETGTLLIGGPTNQVHSFERTATRLYAGTYSGAILIEYDPTEPYDFEVNPAEVVDLGSEHQDRMLGLEDVGDRLAIGTLGKRGTDTGRLAFYDYATGAVQDEGGILPGHQIIALERDGDILYGGTSVNTPGAAPTEPEAFIFAWDLPTDTLLWTSAPITGEQSIADLEVAPDGRLWAITNSHKIFLFDPADRQVDELIDPLGTGGTSGRATLEYAPDGQLYGSSGNGIVFHIDTTAFTRDNLTIGANLAIDSTGLLYFSRGTELWVLDP